MKIKATMSYLGTNYQGWAKQVDAPTIQGLVEKAISTYFNKPTNIYASGRTDKGVHAYKQTFHFESDKHVDLSRMRYSLNMMLPNDMNISSLEEVISLESSSFIISKFVRSVKPDESDVDVVEEPSFPSSDEDESFDVWERLSR